MQHATSPHVVEIGGKRRVVQCASLVLCHSRMRFCQVYPTFNRFYCKTFLTAALQFFGGSARRCMIDNSHVVLAGGSGKDAIVAPEMEAFARRFGFAFEAHAIGYAERSARVERSFHEVKNNFYPGRTFASLTDCNDQLRGWRVTKNGVHRRHLQASPLALFAAEQPTLLPLPLHVPEVVDVVQRTVDTSAEVRVETNRYSVPDRLIGQRVEVLASLARIRVVHRHEVVADHIRAEDGATCVSAKPPTAPCAGAPSAASPPARRRCSTPPGPRSPRWSSCFGGPVRGGPYAPSGAFTACTSTTRPRPSERCSSSPSSTASPTSTASRSGCCVASGRSSSASPPPPRMTMDEELDPLLADLKLHKVREIVTAEIERAAKEKPSWARFLARLLRKENTHRRERSLTYRIEQARFPERWSLATFPFDQQPGVDPTAVRTLAELEFVGRAQNVVFIGPTGVGKTGIASAILLRALENGHRGLFIRAQDLFDEMDASLADRSTRVLLDRLRRVDVLLIHEMGYLNLKPEQCNFFKLMEERYGKKPAFIATNLEYEEWYGFLGRKQKVGALLDRLRHRCPTVRIDGPSLRTPGTYLPNEKGGPLATAEPPFVRSGTYVGIRTTLAGWVHSGERTWDHSREWRQIPCWHASDEQHR
jgi:DNA replication protein DnaC